MVEVDWAGSAELAVGGAEAQAGAARPSCRRSRAVDAPSSVKTTGFPLELPIETALAKESSATGCWVHQLGARPLECNGGVVVLGGVAAGSGGRVARSERCLRGCEREARRL